MKNTFKLFLVLFMVSFSFNVMAQPAPTYNLFADNIQLQSINAPDDAVTFDIHLLWTNSDVSQNFEYSLAQYFFTFNRNVLTDSGNPIILPCDHCPNDTTKWSYKIIGSGLPLNAVPRNPSFQNLTNNPQIPPDQAVLRLASNTVLGCGNGPTISNLFPGTLIVKMRLWNKQGTFNVADLDLQWRNPPAVDVTTLIFYYDQNCMITDITTPDTHAVLHPIWRLLPVELASFTSAINKNNVTLNWSTTKETNNQGFEIERQISGSNNWANAGNVTGNGTTEETHNYSFTERVNTGTYDYRLKQIDYNGNFTYFSLSGEVIVGVPGTYNMSQNYPNPFNPSTKIDYDLPYDGKVSIVLYDISGREVASLVNEVKTAGYYQVNFNASNLASGMYFYRINAAGNAANNFVQTKKMVLIK